MHVFNNQQRSGYEEIASYSPRYYRSIKEMDAVFRLGGWLIDLMAQDMEDMVSFQFLKYMNEGALGRYEHFLGIENDGSRTLEERKAHIRAVLLGAGKLSRDVIIKMINQYEACDCTVELLGSILYITMSFKDNNDKYIKEIRRLIRTVGPAHLTYRFDIRFYYTVSVTQRIVLKSIRIVVGMPFFACRTMDGTWAIDGEIYLCQKRRYQLAVGIRNILGISGNTGVVGMALGFSAKTYMEQYICAGANSHIEIRTEPLEERTGVRLCVGVQPGCGNIGDTMVTNKTRGYWFLDGGRVLDGSGKLNSVFKMEEI